ncbi:nucleotidyltransferase family protein [Devosia sp. LjRoot3]|uniref:nucleotidyltransferase family protein n=1 Tax=Devosia sp. LjRoot3 TaxID=3342319 RepID=UPI003F4F5F20
MQHASAEDALRANTARLLAIFDRYRVTNPRLFGSVARGEADHHSDIDILISKTAAMDYATIGALRKEVSATLGWPVHLTFESALKPEIRDAIHTDLRPQFSCAPRSRVTISR